MKRGKGVAEWSRGLVTLLLGTFLSAQLHAGTHHYYYTDPQGNVLAKADAQGNIIATYDYAPYGSSVPNLGSPPNGPGYSGHVNDPDTGLIYMQARYYDPAVGRFLSVDPVQPSAGNSFNFNRYDYTSNNPVNHIDPDGRQVAPGDDGPIALNARYGDGAGIPSQAANNALMGALSVIPYVSDAQNISDAVQNPTPASLSIAVVGLLPEVGPVASKVVRGAEGGARAGKAFTRAGKAEVKAANAAAHDGKTICGACGRETVPAQQSRAGVTPSGDETHVDHVIPKSKNGNGSPDNGQVLCRDCNLKKGADHE
ncbi:RHS repeat-associated core domain-containing protein [Rhodanobacter glycinis]|nr:RHS repeat-associated core domain-containing protein [Rhodanobacter glycinis]